MATNQPAVARVEAGRVLPALPFIERWMLATGSTLTLPLGVGLKRLSARAKSQLARQATQPPDPWARLSEKRRRGLDTAVEARYLRSMRIPKRSRQSVETLQAEVQMIGVDDLFLDRLSQATATMNVRDMHFDSLVAVAVTNWDDLDRGYITSRIREIELQNPILGSAMRLLQRRCARRVRDLRARQRATDLRSR